MKSIILLFILIITSFAWIPWPFSIISEPKEAIASALYFSEATMKKNSTISLYFQIVVVADSYVWFGKKQIALDNGRVLNGTWSVSPNGTYYQDEIIKV